jgi:hypothetical protein
MKHITLSLFLLGFFALQVSAQSFLKNGEIPKDLVIELKLSSTIEFFTHYDMTITADGKVYLEVRSNLPQPTNFSRLLGIAPGKNKPEKLKTPKLEDRLSKKQIRKIIGEFEKSGFFAMNEYYEGDPNPATDGTCVNHAEIKGLSISANGRTKRVAFFLGCTYAENSPLKSFLALYDKISKELSGVKKIDSKKRQAKAEK